MIKRGMECLQALEQPDNIELSIPLFGMSAVILPTDDLSVQSHSLLSDEVDASILDHMAPST
jgi:hypothetical protein